MPVALEIGYLVSHALNGIEIGLALVILAFTLLAKWSRQVRRLTLLISLLLATQTVLLYTVLDARTLAIIRRTDPPAPSYHPLYIGLEVVKLLLLLYLTYLQLDEHDASLRETAQVRIRPTQG